MRTVAATRPLRVPPPTRQVSPHGRLLISVAMVAGFTLVSAPDAATQTGSFLQTLLKVAGVSATPSHQKGPGDDLENGDVWLANLTDRTRLRVTRAGGYRSPVFAAGDRGILALKRGALVSIPVTGGEGTTLHALTGASKLVGVSPERPQEVLALFEGPDGAPWLGFVALPSGQVTRVPHDRSSREHRAMIAHVEDWQRVYGDTSVYVKTDSKQGLTGAVEWTDVYVKRQEEPENVSQCDGVNCGQPSLSHDGRHVVFVKAAR
jgi:hypothetical protein